MRDNKERSNWAATGDNITRIRLAIHAFEGRVTVPSDNANYPDWPDPALNELNCIAW